MRVQKDIHNYMPDNGSSGFGTQKLSKRLSTTDATATNIYAVSVAVGEAVAITVRLVGKKSDATAAFGSQGLCEARRQSAGNVTIVGTAVTTAREDSAGTPAITFNANTSTQQLEVKCTGIAAETWLWEAHIEVTKV